MAEFLVIRLGNDPEHAANWIAVDDQGTRRTPPVTGPLAEAAKDVGSRDVIVLVPATEVLSATVDIPIKGGARLRAALPFALEEQLANDVENLHFAVGERGESGLLPVSVVAREQMFGWLQVLRNAAIVATRIIPENHGLARIPGTFSMLVAEEQVMFNDGAESEFVMQGVSPSDALAMAGVLQVEAASDKKSSGHLLVYCEPGEEVRFGQDWNTLRQELTSVDINLLPDGVLPRLAVTVAAGRGVNLLQGPYGARTDYRALFEPWKYAAGLLLALLLLGFAGKGADYYRLAREQASLQEQFAAEYRQIRPDDTREIVDPQSLVAEERGRRGAPVTSDVFLPSMFELSQALQQNSAAQIEAISYRAGVVDVRLTAPDVATLDNIQRLVGAAGRFGASIQSTDQLGDKVSSRIQIREDGA
ncbi:MAG: type II secretion system protein GspL [Proteobacteria bacterium]|nr:type II secretion system protein GspL [Pseudomonadota bacterium]